MQEQKKVGDGYQNPNAEKNGESDLVILSFSCTEKMINVTSGAVITLLF